MYACPFNTLMVENRRELEPNTAIHVVLLQATREAAECTNPVMMISVTFSPSPSGSGSKAMYTQVFPLEVLGTKGMEERSPVADRNELVVRRNRFGMPRGFFVRGLDCNVRVTIWVLAPFALGLST